MATKSLSENREDRKRPVAGEPMCFLKTRLASFLTFAIFLNLAVFHAIGFSQGENLAAEHPEVVSELSDYLAQADGHWKVAFIDKCSFTSMAAAVAGWQKALRHFGPSSFECIAIGVGWSRDKASIDALLDAHPECAKYVLPALVDAGHGADAMQLASSRQELDESTWLMLGAALYRSGDVARALEAIKASEASNQFELLSALRQRREEIVAKQALLNKVPRYWRLCFPWQLTRTILNADVDRDSIQQTLKDNSISDEEKCRSVCQYGLMSFNGNKRAEVKYSIDQSLDLIGRDSRLNVFLGIPLFLSTVVTHPRAVSATELREDRIQLAMLLAEDELSDAIQLLQQPKFASRKTIDVLAVYLATRVSEEECIRSTQFIENEELRAELLMSVLAWTPVPYD